MPPLSDADHTGSTPPIHVLLADDSRMVRASLIRHIKDICHIQEAGDGAQAWAILQNSPDIDLLITDIGMPVMDGYALLAHLRQSQDSYLRHLPAIVISGEEDEKAREKAREAGATDFITKGIRTAELRARVESLGALVQTRRALANAQKAQAAPLPVDPETGLASRAYLVEQGRQHLASARRHQTSVSVMFLRLEAHESLKAHVGEAMFERILHKLGHALKGKVRTEDTVCQEAPAGFVVLSPLTELQACRLFAQRLIQTVSGIRLTYRGQNVQLQLRVGMANSVSDDIWDIDRLLAHAAHACEKSAFMPENATEAALPADALAATNAGLDARLLSLDALRERLQKGESCEDISLPCLLFSLMPLLELVESRTGFDLSRTPLQRLLESGP